METAGIQLAYECNINSEVFTSNDVIGWVTLAAVNDRVFS